MKDKAYLGDGVYAERDEYDALILKASNGEEENDLRIYFEDEVIVALLRYLKIWRLGYESILGTNACITESEVAH
ncbi:MAG: hypothetical protein M0R80_13440 [Proteobacteria bacterium]|jgi:hypothetical protein|nr:hypothetical protein [Pseudomonadota bacterium]